jgi:hypothetical protein
MRFETDGKSHRAGKAKCPKMTFTSSKTIGWKEGK